MVAMDYYELKDEAQQIARFGRRTSEAELSDRVFAKATELEVPLEQSDIVVSRTGTRTQIEVFYREDVELFATLLLSGGPVVRRRRICLSLARISLLWREPFGFARRASTPPRRRARRGPR